VRRAASLPAAAPLPARGKAPGAGRLRSQGPSQRGANLSPAKLGGSDATTGCVAERPTHPSFASVAEPVRRSWATGGPAIVGRLCTPCQIGHCRLRASPTRRASCGHVVRGQMTEPATWYTTAPLPDQGRGAARGRARGLHAVDPPVAPVRVGARPCPRRWCIRQAFSAHGGPRAWRAGYPYIQCPPSTARSASAASRARTTAHSHPLICSRSLLSATALRTGTGTSAKRASKASSTSLRVWRSSPS